MVKKVLFIQLAASSFIKKDEEILRKHFDVKPFLFKHRKGFGLIPELFRETFFILKNIYKSQFIYIWFADFHAVIPAIISRLFGKKCVIVIGGVDAAFDRKLKYGTQTKLLGKISLKISTHLASLLLPVTNYTYRQLLQNVSPRLASKSAIVHNCFDQKFEYQNNEPEKRENIISVCLAGTVKTLQVKGIDFLLEVAAMLPLKHFVIVGLHGEAKKWVMTNKTSNVEVVEPVPHSELLKYYKKAAVICQFSRHESFGVALLEGIASGCFPVGHQIGGIAEILEGSAGLLINQLDVSMASNAIQEAFGKSGAEQRALAHGLIEKFSCKKREHHLCSLLQNH